MAEGSARCLCPPEICRSARGEVKCSRGRARVEGGGGKENGPERRREKAQRNGGPEKETGRSQKVSGRCRKSIGSRAGIKFSAARDGIVSRKEHWAAAGICQMGHRR